MTFTLVKTRLSIWNVILTRRETFLA